MALVREFYDGVKYEGYSKAGMVAGVRQQRSAAQQRSTRLTLCGFAHVSTQRCLLTPPVPSCGKLQTKKGVGVSTTKVELQSRQTSKYYRLASSAARGVVNFSTPPLGRASTPSSR